VRLTDVAPRPQRSCKGRRASIGNRQVVDGIFECSRRACAGATSIGKSCWWCLRSGTRRDVARSVARLLQPTRCGVGSTGDDVQRRFVHAGKKGGRRRRKDQAWKAFEVHVVVDGQGVPLGIHVTSARSAAKSRSSTRRWRRCGCRTRRGVKRLSAQWSTWAYDRRPGERLADYFDRPESTKLSAFSPNITSASSDAARGIVERIFAGFGGSRGRGPRFAEAIR